MDEVDQLLEKLKDSNAQTRRSAVERLIEIGEPALSGLLDALKDKDPNMRYRSAWVLGRIGHATAVPVLREALKDTNKIVRLETVGALRWIGDATAVPALIEALGDDTKVRHQAAEALISIVKKTEIPLSEVETHLQEYVDREGKKGPDERGSAKREAASAYAKIAEAISERKKADMPGVLSSGTVPKPSGKKDIYRTRRAVNG